MYKLLGALMCCTPLLAATLPTKRTKVVIKSPKRANLTYSTYSDNIDPKLLPDDEATVDEPFDDQETDNFRYKSGDIVSRFTPYNDCAGNIVHMINHTTGKIYVMAYPLTCPRIIRALIRAAERGVKVRILLDKHYRDRPQLEQLKNHQNVKILVDVEPAIAHHKIMIYSNMKPNSAQKWFKCAVHNGSFNFSQAAQLRNTENILIMVDNKKQYMSFYRNWKRRKHNSKVQTVDGNDYSQIHSTIKGNRKKTEPRKVRVSSLYRND